MCACQTVLLFAADPPKVDVFQPNKKECGIAVQMRKSVTLSAWAKDSHRYFLIFIALLSPSWEIQDAVPG